MKRLLLLLLALSATPAEAKPPNIIFILADDLGYGDVGVFHQDALRAAGDRANPWHLTPQLGAMAAEGLQLRGHYCPAPVCAPSRASLLLGVHQGHANVRNNQFDKALANQPTIASVLRAAGYSTAAIGKWGLQGGPGEGTPESEKASPASWPAFPTKRGFDFYFGYVRHRDGHFHYPAEDGRQVWENERELSAELAGCYTTDLFTARAKKWIADEHAAHPERPLFLYLAYDTPHAKLQYPPCPYPKDGVQWLGQPGHMLNTAAGTPDSFCHPDYAEASWDHDRDPATPEKPWPDVYKRFATDVRRIDDGIGDLLRSLREQHLDEETLVIFTSDNGPSQESYLPQAYEANFFHSFGPFDGIKRDCWEGGIRVGAIARWPGQIAPARVSEAPSQFQDWMPTFAELAGILPPARTDGVSLVPTLRNTGRQEPSRVYVEYEVKGKTPAYPQFEPAHRGRARQQMQALRLGDFIGVRYGITSQAQPFEIYHIVQDPKEAHDLGGSPEYAQLQREMHETVLRVRRPDPAAPRPYDAELVPAVAPLQTTPGVWVRKFNAPTPWIAKLDTAAPISQQTALRPAFPPGQFSSLFSGFIEAPEDGEYTFVVQSGVLRLHEATVIDEGAKSGSIRLQKGKHPFRLYLAPDEKSPALRWSHGPSEPVEIPESAFSYPKP